MVKATISESTSLKKLEINVSHHPCFSEEASKTTGRIHLPVAPACNIQCNFCNRKYDCVAESRPGVTSKVLTPEGALARLEFVLDNQPEIKVVGIAGPGDPLANAPETLKTLRLIRMAHPELSLCISTNGLLLEKHLPELLLAGLSHITITINGLNPKVVSKIYGSVNYNGGTFEGEDAAKLLIDNQLAALLALGKTDILVKINVVLIPDINDDDIFDLVDELKKYKAVSCVNIMPFIPVKGSRFEKLRPPKKELLQILRSQLEPKIPQISHCCQCRSDAIGKLGCSRLGRSSELLEALELYEARAESILRGLDEGTKVALASSNSRIVDEHFGHAAKFEIYRYSQSGFVREPKRNITPFCCSNDDSPIERLSATIHTLSDCTIIVCTKVGKNPKFALESAGFKIIENTGKIDDILKDLKNSEY